MLKISFEENITNTIITIKKVFDELNISAYLIGAQARDVWFLPMKSPRISRDIDWVKDSDELKTHLIQILEHQIYIKRGKILLFQVRKCFHILGRFLQSS